MRRYRFLWLILAAYMGYLLWPQLRLALGLAPHVGTEVPAFRTQDLNGNTTDIKTMTGKVVLINFWATWCPPCRTEMPGFEQVYRNLHQRGFEILAISLDDGGIDPVAQFVAELQLTFPVIAGNARIARAFGGANVVPTSYLIDRQGRIRSKVVGAFDQHRLQTAVEQLLRESDAALTAPN